MSGNAKETEGRGTVAVFMRLPADDVDKLDAIARGTGGSRGDAVKLLLSTAPLEYETVTVTVAKLQPGSQKD